MNCCEACKYVNNEYRGRDVTGTTTTPASPHPGIQPTKGNRTQRISVWSGAGRVGYPAILPAQHARVQLVLTIKHKVRLSVCVFVRNSNNSPTLRSGFMKFCQRILCGISRSTRLFSARYVVPFPSYEF
jgi:hypothetical protein